MRSLVWAIKGSLLEYVRRMPDGSVALDGVTEVAGGFSFPAIDAESFSGSVTLVGHDGMMHVVIADPAVLRTDTGWLLTIADDTSPGGRLPFATIVSLDDRGDGVRTAATTRLTADGADLFFGPYREGTPLDDPRITV